MSEIKELKERSFKVLTPQERKTVTTLRATGISIAEISKRLRCVRQSVSLYLRDPENYVQNSERGLKPSQVTPTAQYLADKKKFQSNAATAAAAANTMLSHHHFQRFDYTEGTSKKKDKKSSHQDEMRYKPMPRLTGKNYRVLHKYRAVIEFLTKCGQTPSWIQKEIERVYSVVIDLSCIQFWAAPFQKDRPKNGQKKGYNSQATKPVQKHPKYLLKFRFANMKCFGALAKSIASKSSTDKPKAIDDMET